MAYRPGQSGNPAGGKPGPQKRTAQFRKLIADSTNEIARKIIENAKLGDPAAQALFVKNLMPRHRFVAEPINLPPAKTVTEIQAQIGELVSLTAAGQLDLDALVVLSRALTMAVSTKMEELEELLSAQENGADDEQD